jgi:uncharacterized membrane protein (UPF0127 family)
VRAATLIVALGAILAAPACHHSPPIGASGGTLVIRTPSGTATLRVQVADTPSLRANGLMGRASLAPDAGMAFLWPAPTTETFWMKDTLIPLSIAFWDGANRIVAIREMTPCASDPCKTYGAPVAYFGAVEASASWFEEHGVKVGDSIEMTRAG